MFSKLQENNNLSKSTKFKHVKSLPEKHKKYLISNQCLVGYLFSINTKSRAISKLKTEILCYEIIENVCYDAKGIISIYTL